MMKKFTFRMLSLSLMMFLGVFAFGQFTTTFNVDMTDAEEFDAATDEIFMSGSFAGWAEPGSDPAFKMEPVEAGSMIYTFTTAIDSGEVQYKYFRVIGGAPSWENGEWTGEDNRIVYLNENTIFDNVWANRPAVVTFEVDMTDADPFDPATDAVYIAGTLASGWAQPGTISNFMMTPTNDNEMIYGIKLSLYHGDYSYKFFRVIEGVASWDNGEDVPEDRVCTIDTAQTEIVISDVWSDINAGIFNEANIFNYSMYPNPANDFLTVANTADVSKVDIYDVTGKMMMTVNVASENVTLNIADFKAGMYIINVTNEKGVQTSKFVKN